MGDFAGLQLCLRQYSHSLKIKEVPQVSLFRSDPSIQISSILPVSSCGVHSHGQGGQVDVPEHRYKDPPVPRRLVDKKSNQGFLSPGQPESAGPMSGYGLAGKSSEV